MTTESAKNNVQKEVGFGTVAEFLESMPPNQASHISDIADYKETRIGLFQYVMRTPEIQLHCPNDYCNGMRFFRCISGSGHVLKESYEFCYLIYRCSNCQEFTKTFSLAARLDKKKEPKGELYKFGEMPPFGPPTPPRLVKLIGPDRDTFLKGRRCENQGLGIGAFIYYRRVVENQKDRILNEIIKVLEKLSASDERINVLRSAVDEVQFSKALDIAKDSIPETLLINGHSPIRLLHGALSEGIHALSDEECLELASSVRVVLAELSERLSQALKDEAELSKALSTLMHRNKG